MREISLLVSSKETDNKLRWEVDVDGTPFELYIPKEQVPEPWPGRIYVEIWSVDECPQLGDVARTSLDDPIRERVRWYRNRGHTAQYQPVGDPSSWQLGEPYIPYALLADPPQRDLFIRVRWDRSTPWKPTR